MTASQKIYEGFIDEATKEFAEESTKKFIKITLFPNSSYPNFGIPFCEYDKTENYEEVENKNDKIFFDEIKEKTRKFWTKNDEKTDDALNEIKKLIEQRSRDGFNNVCFLITSDSNYYYSAETLGFPNAILTRYPPLTDNHVCKLKNKLIELGFNVANISHLELYRVHGNRSYSSYDYIYGYSMNISWAESKQESKSESNTSSGCGIL